MSEARRRAGGRAARVAAREAGLAEDEKAVHAGISFQDLVVWMVDNAECDA